MAEAGVAGNEMDSWMGVFAAAGTPPAIVNRLNTEIVEILNSPEIHDKLTALGANIVADSPEHCAAFVKSETAKWAELVKKIGARID